ncbi:response regulator [Vaginisenegalia massiliensis]|uniref:response regulator n=1 Tax=Vaginisenegalia massiliensis TaxID=2058294 RepID=UPI000F52FFB6|nr:response regulator transcription factor [Vaginisenegalia massiliensis]
MTSTHNLIIIDDDPLVVQSLVMITQAAGYHVIATGQSASQAIELAHLHQPDLILMDIRMQDQTGIEAAQTILTAHPQIRILLVTTFEDESFLNDAIQFGCRGYILKQNIHTLLPAMEAVLAGNIVLDQKITQSMTKAHRTASPNFDHLHLTQRELDIYHCVAQGLNNKEIADRLFLSEGTVRNYISQLLEKVGVRDRTQLAISYYHSQNKEA